MLDKCEENNKALMLLKYIILIVAIIIVASIISIISIMIHIILLRSDYNQAYSLRNQLEIWISNGCEDNGPSGYKFKQLFKRAFPGKAGDYDKIITQLRPMVKEMTVNTVDCFPSTYKELVDRHFSLLNHMCDIFKTKHDQIYKPIYWLRIFVKIIKFIIFLPGKMFNYLGTNSSKIEKAANAIWWILWIIPIVVKFIKSTL